MQQLGPLTKQSAPTSPRDKLRGGVIVGLIALVSMLVAAVTVIRLSFDAGSKIEVLGTANTDSSQWALAQTEVEFGAFQLAIERALNTPDPDLREVRRRFDVFYSRIGTVRNGVVFRTLVADTAVDARLGGVQTFLDQTVPLIDGPDDRLRASLAQLSVDATRLREDLRWISLEGVGVFAHAAEVQREAVFSTLSRLGVLTFAFFFVLALSLIALGLSARRNQTEAGRRAEASSRFEAIVRTSIDGIVVADAAGRVIEFNEAAQAIFGYAAAEAEGRLIQDLIIPPHLRAAHASGMARYQTTGEARVVGRGRVQLEAMRKDGSLVQTEVAISSSRSMGREIFVAYLRDITAQLCAEAELVSARDKAIAGEKAKADLLAVMSHEMRTPLNGMLGTLELLCDTRLTEKQASYLQIIGRSGRILLQHVNDVLDVSRLNAGKMDLQLRPFDPVQMVGEVVAGLAENAHAHGNDLRAEVVALPPGQFIGDETRLQQVVFNLVGNAIKFTRNGSVTVQLAHCPDGSGLEFRVTDTGIGIPPDQADRIFQDFVTVDSSYRRNAEGTGLGLGICKRLVTAMQGEIGVDSEIGKGSTFWVRVPLAKAPNVGLQKPASRASARRARPVKSANALNLLVVEDNQINRLVVREMLAKLGHRVTEAVNGEEGVRLAGQLRFDAILMDISMPGMDGVTATRVIRQGDGPCRAVPIFALTAHALPSDVERFHAAGMTDAMTKPISGEVLARTLKAVRPAAPDKPAPKARKSRTPLIDETVLRELIDLVGQDRLAPMFDDYVAETDTTLAELAKQIGRGMDFEEFEKTSHKIAGSAAVFGAAGLRKSLLGLEAAARAKDLSTIRADFPKAQAIWRDTRLPLAAQIRPAG